MVGRERARLRAIGTAVVAAALFAAVWMPVTGRAAGPNPFDTVEVVESGSDAARAAGESIGPAPPNPFEMPTGLDVVESGSGAARAAGEEIRSDSRPADNPFDIPVDVVESGTPKAEELAGEMLPLAPVPDPLEGWTPQNPRERHFIADSRFPANPTEDSALFRFDLRLVQFVDSSRAKGKFTQYVNTRDGSVALLEPDAVVRALGGQPIPDVILEFVLFRPGGNGLACGVHKDIGNGCIKLGGHISVGMGQLDRFDGLYHWLESASAVSQSMPGVGSGTQPGRNTVAARGRLPDGAYMSLWRETSPSMIQTSVPWLGFGAGIYKDYLARQNRVAQVVVWERADLHTGNVAFKLLEQAPEQRSFDTRGYPLVTAFTVPAINSAQEFGLQVLSETLVKAQDLEAALRACPKGSAGKACRDMYREQIKTLNDTTRDAALDWARKHGIPVEKLQ